jgi:hypothetical protein
MMLNAMPIACRRIRFPVKLTADQANQIPESHDLEIAFRRDDLTADVARRVIAAFGELESAPRFRAGDLKVVLQRLTEFIARNRDPLATGFARPCEIPLSYTEPRIPRCSPATAFAKAAPAAPLPQASVTSGDTIETPEAKPLEEVNVQIGGRRARNR